MPLSTSHRQDGPVRHYGRALAGAAVDLVAPRGCLGCGRPGLVLCGGCAAPLAGPVRRTWPDPAPAGFPPTFTVSPYEGVVREAVVAYKERARADLRVCLAVALSRSVSAAVRAVLDPPDTAGIDLPGSDLLGIGLPGSDLPGSDLPGSDLPGARPVAVEALPVVVPVPSSPAATRRRGTDPTRALVAAAARRAGLGRRVAPALRLARRVSDQAGLGARERVVNLTGALVVRRCWAELVAGAPVVIVDDVVTTGATLAEAARALRAAGASRVTAAVLAATPRRTSRRPHPEGVDRAGAATPPERAWGSGP